jgi:Na+-translocating ferredoxin:NAD+ oxidoreductase RnfG subunit
MESIGAIIALIGGLGAAIYVGIKQYGKNKSAEAQMEIIKNKVKEERKANEETHKQIHEAKHDVDARDRVRSKYQRD